MRNESGRGRSLMTFLPFYSVLRELEMLDSACSNRAQCSPAACSHIDELRSKRARKVPQGGKLAVSCTYHDF